MEDTGAIGKRNRQPPPSVAESGFTNSARQLEKICADISQIESSQKRKDHGYLKILHYDLREKWFNYKESYNLFTQAMENSGSTDELNRASIQKENYMHSTDRSFQLLKKFNDALRNGTNASKTSLLSSFSSVLKTNEIRTQPVSYTHLTLPTKRIV